MPPELRGPFLEEADFGRIWLAGASADYGRSTFRYADTVNAAFKSQVEEPFALNLGVGLYIPTKRMLVAANIRREQAFDGGAARQYCIPTGAPGATQCRSVALGAPTERNATLVSLETRWFVTEHYGLSPRFTANTSATKEIGFELPIVVRQDTDEGFNSAFAIGWKSKASSPDVDDRIYVSLILGVTYGVGLKF
jgi:hypothetical protein